MVELHLLCQLGFQFSHEQRGGVDYKIAIVQFFWYETVSYRSKQGCVLSLAICPCDFQDGQTRGNFPLLEFFGNSAFFNPVRLPLLT